jgi:hypothetical protein
MLITDLLPYIFHGFTYFLIGIGISTFFFPVRMTLHGFHGILVGIAYTSSYNNPDDGSEINYIFLQIHLIFFSLGVFINIGPK